MFTKISKIARFFLLVLFFTIGFLYVVFRSSPVQSWMLREISGWLSGELGAEVRVGAVDIRFFKTAVLEHVYVEDQKGDTMFYFRKIKVDYNTYDPDKRIISLNYLGLEGLKVLFGEHKGDSVNNYEFFIDYLDGGPRDPSKPKIVWTVYGKKVEIEDGRFDYFNRNEPKPDFMDFDYNDMSYRGIYADLRDFYLIDDSLHFNTVHLETTEKCGFRVDHLTADTKIHEGGIEFHKLNLLTPDSRLGDMFVMRTLDWKDYNDFNEKVVLKANLKNASLNTKDLSYFSNNLKSWQTRITMTGAGEGPLSRIRGKNAVLGLYANTEFRGDWSLTGLPDFDNTILDFNIRKLVTDYTDLNKIALNNLPDNFRSLGRMQYQGMFSGFYNDFVAYGNMGTSIGDFKSDINLKFKEGLDKAVYSGKLSTSFFRIRSFIPEALVDDVSFDAEVKGSGMSRNSFHIKVDGQIPHLTFRGNTFRNLSARGDLSRQFFSGTLAVKDPNLDMDFNGEFRSDRKVPEAHFSAGIRHANLASLGLDSIPQIISGDFVMDFTGNNLDEAVGSITGEHLFISRNGKRVSVPYVNLSAYEFDGIRELRLRSDLLDAGLRGQFKLGLLDVSFMHLLHQLIPSYFDMPAKQLPPEDFTYDFDLKRPYDLTSLYIPRLQIEPCRLKGFYKSTTQTLELNLSNGLVIYDDYLLRRVKVKAARTAGSRLTLKADAEAFEIGKMLHARDVQINSTVFSNIIDFNLAATDTGYKTSVRSAGVFTFARDSVKLNLSEMELDIDRTDWQLDRHANCLFTAGKFLFSDFIFRSDSQSVSVQGALGNTTEQKMVFNLSRFALSAINSFTSGSGVPRVNGLSDGQVIFEPKDGLNQYYSDLDIADLSLNGDTLGDLSVFLNNHPGKNLQHLKIYVDKGLLDSLRIEGDINYNSKDQLLDLYAFLPPTGISVFEPYLKGVFSGMKGQLYSRDSLKISGNLDDPLIEGDLMLKNAELTVDYLKVPLKFSARIISERNRLTILPFTLYDGKGNFGKAKGYVFHKSYKDFNLNLNLYELNKFQVLNTGKADNDLFYGQGFVSGNASFTGPFEKLAIKVNCKTMPGTRFILPISEGDASGLPAYVHFKTLKKKIEKSSDEFPIQSLEMDIEATTDADVEIIFDEILGDKISGTGKGNLKMEMSSSGDFYMFGTYTVERGKYLFTAFDLYNKPFNVRKGGTISWFGDPLNAKLDLVAYNTEVADPSPLLTAVTINSTLNSGRTGSSAAQPITAESELYLKGNLFSPEISFGLNFPKLQVEAGNFTSNLSPVISRIKSDKEEVSRQVFSLLLMRKFLPPSFAQAELGLGNAGSTVFSSAGTDLLSNQLSNWLNKIDPSWKVNVIYKNGSLTLPPEYGLMLSKKFLNEKLSVDGSFSSYSTRPNINLEYKVTKKGNVKIKAYTRSSFNQVNTTSLSTPITTNGVGIVYTKEFNVFRLFRWLKPKKKNKAP